MMFGLPLAFSIPAVLGALVLLPVLYYVLRVTPPRPRAIPFPPLRLILDHVVREETPARMPLWLLLLRLAIAAAVILAMAGPIWNPPAALTGGASPVVVLLDDSFAAAPTWDRRVAAATERLRAAERQGRPTAIVALSEGARAIQTGTATQALDRLRALKPKPILSDRTVSLPALRPFLASAPDATVVWISDGLENGKARDFASALAQIAKVPNVSVVVDADTPAALTSAANTADALDVQVVRAEGGFPQAGRVRALDLKGLQIGDAAFAFDGASKDAHARIELPVELRNQVGRVVIDGVDSAGAVSLLDARGQRRRIGLVSGTTADTAQPLLSPTFYIARALSPYADVRQSSGNTDPIISLLDEQPSVMMLADLNVGDGVAHDRLADFVQNGGILVRFAGARLAGAADDLVPVSLRKGGRSFGGALSWDQPKTLAPFDRTSPFYGLQSHDTVTVNRQVLAEPDPGLADKTWAQLTDGTPLVTAERRGKGTIVLFHVTADTTWSNLPLSGLFVDMLRRVVALSNASPATKRGDANGAAATEAPVSLAPSRTLDGFGVLGPPPPTAKPLVAAAEDAVADADHPPGIYGTADGAIALNALAPNSKLTRANLAGLGFGQQALTASEPIDLRIPLVVIALVAFLLDGLATIWLAGGLRRRGRMPLAAAVLLGCGLAAGWGPPQARAADQMPAISQQDMRSALSVRLAYVVTGDNQIDDVSRQGLSALSHALAERTSLAPGDVIGVDPARDELAFYPLLYWPVAASRPKPSPAAIEKIAAFMKHGGTIVFDTRDALTARPGAPPTAEGAWLRELLSGIDVPDIEPLPADHVITRTFYILAGFVGRYATGQTWIEALPPATGDEASRPARAGDSVSPIVITSNDLASAWAQDSDGQPLFPLVPGGARQRELALRGGINLVMYTLTGNYKADQVHVRDLLERLSR